MQGFLTFRASPVESPTLPGWHDRGNAGGRIPGKILLSGPPAVSPVWPTEVLPSEKMGIDMATLPPAPEPAPGGGPPGGAADPALAEIEATGEPAAACRARAVLWVLAGVGAAAAAARAGVHRATVHDWVRRYRASGPAALLGGPRGGRRPPCPARVRRAAVEAARAAPGEAGAAYPLWTLARLGRHLRRVYGVAVPRPTLARFLDQAGVPRHGSPFWEPRRAKAGTGFDPFLELLRLMGDMR